MRKIFLLSMLLSLPLCAQVTLNDVLAQKGFSAKQRNAFLILLRETGGLSHEIVGKEREDVKGKSLREFVAKSNIKELQDQLENIADDAIESIGSLITFNSNEDADAFLISVTQVLWFRKQWEEERSSHPNAHTRWNQVDSSNYEEILGRSLKELGVYDEIKRPKGFTPNIIFFLGAIESAARARINGDIPDGYEGEIVVHSNRRGLLLTRKVFESTAVSHIAQQLGLEGDKEAAQIIQETCCSYPHFYQISEDGLAESTHDLRKMIIKDLVESKKLSNESQDFAWPTHRDLYKSIFIEAQTRLPKKLDKAILTFDDPAPLAGGRIHSTESEAKAWLQRMKKKNSKLFEGNTFKILALSCQPFVAIQQENLEAALHPECEVVTVGPGVEDTPNTRKDALESLAKILYVKGKKDTEIRKRLPWIK